MVAKKGILMTECYQETKKGTKRSNDCLHIVPSVTPDSISPDRSTKAFFQPPIPSTLRRSSSTQSVVRTSSSLSTNSTHSLPCLGSQKHSMDSMEETNEQYRKFTTSNESNQAPKNSQNAQNTPFSRSEHDHTSRDYYFDSYSHHGIHEEMLKDEVRTRTYQMAILNNAHLFVDKVVLDVGCGTGILSMFAAKAGAKHVYAVDCSSIINQASQIVERNGFKDQITLIQGKIEEIELPVSKVDIIISEWMGYFLLYESMLDTVIFARDKWLIENGIIFPDKAVMYICAMEDAQVKQERIDFWDNVYGFDMSPIKDIAYLEPVVDIVDSKSIVSTSTAILNIDILNCTKEELSFKANFQLQAQRNDYVHGFVAYFECAFTQIHKPIGFSTSPYSKYTHWKQTIFYLKDVITICDGETIHGTIECKPNNKNPRDLDIKMNVNFTGRHSRLESNMDYKLR